MNIKKICSYITQQFHSVSGYFYLHDYLSVYKHRCGKPIVSHSNTFRNGRVNFTSVLVYSRVQDGAPPVMFVGL